MFETAKERKERKGRAGVLRSHFALYAFFRG